MKIEKLTWKFYCSRLKTNSKKLIEEHGWKSEEQFISWIKKEFIQLPEKSDEIWELLQPKKIVKKVESQLKFSEVKPEEVAKKPKNKKKQKSKPSFDKMSLVETPKENKNGKKTSN